MMMTTESISVPFIVAQGYA